MTWLHRDRNWYRVAFFILAILSLALGVDPAITVGCIILMRLG